MYDFSPWFLFYKLTVAYESRALLDKRVTDMYNASQPTHPRTEEACVERWKSMTQAHKFALFYTELTGDSRHIRDFSAGRINGSTGSENWWVLSKEQKRKSLNKKALNSLFQS